MNYEDFNNKLQKRSAIDKYWNYFISIGAILFGLYWLYTTHTIEFIDAYKAKHNKEYPILAAYLITTGLTSLGLYGFWRIPKTYKVTKIKAEHSAEQKVQIIDQLITDFKLKEFKNDEEYQHFRYVGRFWNRFDIFISYDSNNFYLNAQQRELLVQSGFIDFGTSKKVTNKFKSKIQSYIIKESTL